MAIKYGPSHVKTMEARCREMEVRGWTYYALLERSEDHYFITDWCHKVLKPNETVTWHGMQFWFKNKDDYMQFVMTWQ